MTTTLPARTGLSREERTGLRSRKVRRRRRLAWILTLVVLLVAGAGFYVVRFTAVLGLTSITVDGVQGELAAQVTAQVPPTDGRPLIAIDLDTVREQVLTVPRVDTATVSRNWPNTLVVRVTARVPAAVVSANDSWWLLDADGLPYDTVTPAEIATLDLPSLRLATPGVGDPATVAGLAVAGALPKDLLARLSSVTARTPYDISLELADGRIVQWGDTGQVTKKLQVLGVLLEQAGTEFDISDPDLVTVSGGR